MAERQSFDENGIFDWNQDGKVDMEDYAVFSCFFDDDDDDGNRESSHIRKCGPFCRDSILEGVEQFFAALGAIVVMLFVLWVIFIL